MFAGMILIEGHVFRQQPVEVKEAGSYPYFLALRQDYDQMPRQQQGLRNHALKYMYMSLAREEVSIARFHSVLDKYLGARVGTG